MVRRPAMGTVTVYAVRLCALYDLSCSYNGTVTGLCLTRVTHVFCCALRGLQ
jgi:hypothetical protein